MAILSIEATVISIFNIVFFSAFLGARLSGVLNLAEAITPIIVKFSVENSSRVIVGYFAYKSYSLLQREEFTYMATLGILLFGYTISEILKGAVLSQSSLSASS
ncbi:MAG: hypothetical protein QXJ48_05245 [Candidatus Korarchaeum sp.]|nr:hypothetical protein [Candidatus Bathyarchaeota archaeon]